MSTHHIHVFISHSWAYSDHYETLADWIFNRNWSGNNGQASLVFRDYSVPKNDPIHNAPNDSQLKEAIYRQIRLSHVIVIPTGMYAHYSKWIQKEIEGAGSYSKPILAVNPRGQLRPASVVVEAADKVVGWTSESVVSAIWQLYGNK